MPLSGGGPGVAAGGTAGQLLRKSSNTDYAMEWASLAGIPGAGSADVADRALVPHPSDDEFNNASLTGWTQVNGGGTTTSITWTEAGDALSCHFTNNSSNAVLAQLKPISIGVGGYIQTAFRFLPQTTAGSVSLILSNGTLPASNCVSISSTPFTGSGQNYYNGMAWGTLASCPSSGGVAATMYFAPVHMRFTWLAVNTWRPQWSPDGISWLSLNGAGDFSYTLNPTFMGIGVSSGATGAFAASFEYFRASA
jgi:hypothetical protein